MFEPNAQRILCLEEQLRRETEACDTPIDPADILDHLPDLPPADWFTRLSTFQWWTAHPEVIAHHTPLLRSLALRLPRSFPVLSPPDSADIHGDDTSIPLFLSALQSTVAIERFLGDLIFSSLQSSSPPIPSPILPSSSLSSLSSSSNPSIPSFLPQNMTDMLAHPLVLSSLGPRLVLYLSLLLGCPTALTLRNFLWHGFFLPLSSLPPSFPRLLSSVAAALPLRFPLPLPLPRPLLDLSPLAPSLLLWAPLPAPLPPSAFAALLAAAAPRLPPGAAALLTAAHAEFSSPRPGCHHRALLLLLPALEACMRWHYCSLLPGSSLPPVNVPGLLASNTTHFLIFEDFLAPGSPLLAAVHHRVVSGFCDFLLYPDGPRIRSRVSHGECDAGGVPGALVAALFELLTHYLAGSSEFPHASRFHPRTLLQQQLSAFVGPFNALARCVFQQWPAMQPAGQPDYHEYWRHSAPPHVDLEALQLREWAMNAALPTLHLEKEDLSKLSLLREAAAALLEAVDKVWAFSSALHAAICGGTASSSQRNSFDKFVQHAAIVCALLHKFYLRCAALCLDLHLSPRKDVQKFLMQVQKSKCIIAKNAWQDIAKIS